MIQRRALLNAMGLVSLGLATGLPLSAHAALPHGEGSHPIHLVVPYPPGGPLDVSARAIAETVQAALGTVIVENRPGAGGGVGMATRL